MAEKKTIYIMLFTLVLAVFLCGAVSAAPVSAATTGKTLTTFQSNNITVIGLEASKATAKGNSMNVVTTIKNQGKTASTGTYVYLYLVPTKTLNGAHTYIGKQYVSSMQAGTTKTLENSFIVPYSTETGAYYVAAKYTTGHAFTTSKTNVYYQKIDSGTVYLKTYGKFVWASYLTQNHTVASYTKFYNPNIKANMNQFTRIGQGGTNFLFMYIIPKLTGQSNYYTIFGSSLTPLQYYLNIFKPDMIKNGPNH